ncbi:hypothetical protein [Maridesulfovibrio ferrireducens]|uniref:hypothetical protein n=1 Tax=Maridesulfovibrio ferrireducens TaxID=246191 RepID=UPI001A1C23D9|nr:hypothetical protein [Maridesulfovibrio ferrireducens]MBI9112955.1 hypothetical protein [Maridesulfovibrio ferrireducens]
MNTLMEPLRLTSQLLPKALGDFIALSAIGAPILAVILEITAKAKNKIFYDKLAKQIASMSLIMYVLFLGCAAGAATYFTRQFDWLTDWLINPSSPFIMVYITVGFTLAMLLPYTLLWKSMKKNKPAHILLGTCAALGGISTVHVVTMTMKVFFMQQAATPVPTVPPLPFINHFLVLPGLAGLYLAGLYLIMSLSFAATIGGLYLVLRRNKDDFGRDYYKFSLPVISKWALIPTLAQLAAVTSIIIYLCGPTKELLLANNTTAICLGLSAVLTLLCCAIWIVTWKSATPMRHKIGLTLAPFFTIVAHATVMAGAMNLYLTM